MTEQEVARIVAVLQATWPNHPIPNIDAMLTAWAIGLRGVGYELAMAAVEEWIQTGRFFPSPGEIRSLVPSAKPQLDSRLYSRYGQLRRAYQMDTLTAEQERELAGIEHRLGIAKHGTRRGVPQLQAVS